jgi:hypothetical protein
VLNESKAQIDLRFNFLTFNSPDPLNLPQDLYDPLRLVLQQSLSISSFSCFEIRAAEVILVFRWPDLRSATTVGIALVWRVWLRTLIVHQCGRSPVPPLVVEFSTENI